MCFLLAIFTLAVFASSATATPQSADNSNEVAVHVVTHNVFLFFSHTKLVVTSNVKYSCTDCRFTKRGADEGCKVKGYFRHNYCMTLGAHRVPDDYLKGERNRKGDREEENAHFMGLLFKGEGTKEHIETLVKAMLAHEFNYNICQDRMTYSVYPNGKTTFNSNSFAAALMRYGGADPTKKKLPWWAWAPGYNDEVPRDKFTKSCVQ